MSPIQSPSSIAFFDVDYTLIDGNSGFYSSLRLVKHGVLKKRRIVQAVAYSLAALLFHPDVKKIYEIAISDMAGWPLTKILKIGNECFERDIKKRLFPQGVALVKKHQEKGDRVALLSSGPHMTLQALQKFLKIDEAFTMGPEIINGILTSQIQLPICHAEGKIYYAEEFAKKKGVSLQKCYFYTDHISDLPLLEKVGHPVLVNPSKRLEQIAKKKGWEILKFKR